MVRFLIMAGFVLLFLFVTAVLVSLGLWVVVKVLRAIFPGRFTAGIERERDEA